MDTEQTPWKKVKEEVAYRGYRSMLRRTYEFPGDRRAVFDIIQNDPFVCVAAFDLDGSAILVRQFRPGPEKPLLSFPEGYIEPGESPAMAGARELLEETGFRAGKIEFLKEIRTAYSTERKLCVLAVDCQKTDVPRPDPNEFIQTVLMPVDELRSRMRDSGRDAFSSVDAAYLALDRLDKL
ncbi:MAG: NUDIX hydrolase [Saprospiraceae bacterium]|nr:NUDIX hydrolase [Saprospiraceae bacterium]